jgi:FdhD protein
MRKGNDMYRILPCIRGSGGRYSLETDTVIEEVPVVLIVNGRYMMTATTRPVGLEEFAIGYLYTGQEIGSIEEIESVMVENNTVSVRTRNPSATHGPKQAVTGGDDAGTPDAGPKVPGKIYSDLVLPYHAVTGLTKQVLDSDLSRQGGIHIVGLAEAGGTLHVAMDVGRHNALDRVIGSALMKGIDLSRTFVILSGRISTEMVRKCAVANIPVIVSRGATTSLAVETAKQAGLTVVGFVRGDTLVIYSCPERIAGSPPLADR